MFLDISRYPDPKPIVCPEFCRLNGLKELEECSSLIQARLKRDYFKLEMSAWRGGNIPYQFSREGDHSKYTRRGASAYKEPLQFVPSCTCLGVDSTLAANAVHMHACREHMYIHGNIYVFI